MSIEVKNADVLEEILTVPYHPTMAKVLRWMLNGLVEKVFATSGYRKGDSGVHGQIPCRGLDLRSWIYKYPQCVADVINLNWTYDPGRPHLKVALYHRTSSGAYHLHLQVCDATKKAETG